MGKKGQGQWVTGTCPTLLGGSREALLWGFQSPKDNKFGDFG